MAEITTDASLQAYFTPILKSLEKERCAIIDRNYTLMSIAFGVVLGGGLIAFEMSEFFYWVISLFLGAFIYTSFSNKGAKEWCTKYKNEIIEAIVISFFGEKGTYEPQNGHTPTEFIETQLFESDPDRFYSEDLIKGNVDKTLIRFSEVHAEIKTKNSKGNTSWATLFYGILFTADFNKHFQGRTIVKQKDFWDFTSFGNIELENPQFRKQFAVHADDPIEARYILTPSLMERLLILNKNWGSSLGFSFFRSQLTIAIPMEDDFFDASVWSKIDVQKDWQIIADLVSVVQDLDLNTRIWTKE